MAVLKIKVKHQGKNYDLEVDTESTGEELKLQLYSLTNVEPENQKIIAKKIVKNDTPLSTLGLKDGSVLTLIGNPSSNVIVEAPKERMKFAEDMSEAEMAQQEGAIPAGLTNMGNTCYANATLQTLRAMPELVEELQTYQPPARPSSSLYSTQQLAELGMNSLGGVTDLTGSLRDLYQQMGRTQGGVAPIMFLTTLRNEFEQFKQRDKSGHGYAQQDAEEMWTEVVNVLGRSLTLKGGDEKHKTWVEKYMGGKMEKTLECKEAPEESPVIETENFTTLQCNIRSDTNHLREGIKIGLNEEIEKSSETLGRTAVYTRTSRIARLPQYLPVQFVRFFWRKDTNKKAKILRKVTFQHEIDLTEFCTDELREKLIPVRDRIREVRKEEEDVERAKKRQKRMRKEMEENGDSNVRADEPLQKKKEKEEREQKAKEAAGAGGSAAPITQDTAMTGTEETFKTDEEIDAEKAASILEAKKELLAKVHPDLAADPTASQSGLYELRGVVTHQGSSADSGHYTAYIKKTAAPGKAEDGKWWWFNDDKVQEVDEEKIETLSGGGESHSALILLYRAAPLPKLE